MESIQCRFGDMAHLVASGLEKHLGIPSIPVQLRVAYRPSCRRRLFPCASLVCESSLHARAPMIRCP